MLKKLKKMQAERSNSKGFTIIEVMIVLAIAGLIILIVLLAVPALQRSQRNTSRKSDATRIAAAVTQFVSDNNGVIPGGTSYSRGQATTDAKVIVNDVGTFGQIKLITGGSAIAEGTLAVLPATTRLPAVPTSSATADEVAIYQATTCSTTTATALEAGSPTQIALIYPIEQGSTYIWDCISAN
jgi:prepilin-type N-terminal cleavage/methylation domain-containing protein